MKDKIKKIAVNTKEHLKRQKAAYIMGAVAVTAIVLQQRNLKAFYGFLEDEAIDPEKFYFPEAYEEKQNA